jgi:CheY-like chemotaxis protein
MATILVVDDEVALRGVLARFFRRENHEVLEAADGLEALVHLARSPVDVAFIDVMMPEMDGISLMRRMLQDYAGTGIVVMSAYH